MVLGISLFREQIDYGRKIGSLKLLGRRQILAAYLSPIVNLQI